MAVELTIGAWIVPALVSASAFIVAAMRSEPPSGWFDIGTGIFYYPVALIVSLTAWLVWALV